MMWVLGAFALALGVWLGMPGDRSTSEQESLEKFDKGGSARRETKRRFMWLDYLFRGKKKSQVRERAMRNSRRKPFELVQGNRPASAAKKGQDTGKDRINPDQ